MFWAIILQQIRIFSDSYAIRVVREDILLIGLKKRKDRIKNLSGKPRNDKAGGKVLGK